MTCLSVNELDIFGTLRVAVTSTVLGTSLVVGVLGHTTIGIHLGQVESAIETARKVGHVNIEGELLVDKLKELIFAVALEKVATRADVGASLKLEGQSITGGGDTVSACVVSTIESAFLSASDGVRADASVPCVAGIAVRIAGGGVEPTPVSVEHDRAALGGASALCADLHRECGVVLSRVSADLLTVDGGKKGKGDERSLAEHREWPEKRGDYKINMQSSAR